jgi:hypothetical protein
MTKLALYSAITVLALAPTVAFAAHDGRTTQSFEDQQRCDAFTTQWHQASANSPVNDTAAKEATEGQALCWSGSYDEGSRDLASALRLIGAKPM